jgi:hypothetical protein
MALSRVRFGHRRGCQPSRERALSSGYCVLTATLVAPRMNPPESLKRTKTRLLAGSKGTAALPGSDGGAAGDEARVSRRLPKPLARADEPEKPARSHRHAAPSAGQTFASTERRRRSHRWRGKSSSLWPRLEL